MAYDFEFEVAVGETKTFDLSSKSYGASINNISYVGAARTYVTCAENASDDSKLDVTGNAEGVAVVDVSAGRLALSIQITVTAASVEDQNFLNERGLTHFWENIDDIKQNKLTAGAGISITNDVISATGGGTADAVDWGHITGSMSNQTDLTTALNAKANTADLAAVATSGSYNDLSNKPTIPGGTITGVSVNNTSIATSGVANIPLVSRNLDGAVPRTNAVGGAYDGYVFGIDADTAKWMKLSYNSLSNTPTKVSDFTNDAGYITSYTDTQVTQTRVDPSEITTFYPVASTTSYTNTGDVKKFGAVKLKYASDDGGTAELELGQNSYNDPVGGALTLWNMGSSQYKTTLQRSLGASNQTFYFPYNADSTSGTLIANGAATAGTGSATNPVYADSDGILHPTTYALNATVPSNAVFTDTTYSNATTSAAGLMSASDKTKLNGIATGAEVNVQSDWNVTSTSSDAFIKNKPTIPTRTSQLTNDSGFITDAGVTSFNGSTGAVTYTAPVTSVNGATGAVTGLQTTSNLVTSVSSSSTNAQYPSAKLFYDTIGDVESVLQTLNSGSGAA